MNLSITVPEWFAVVVAIWLVADVVKIGMVLYKQWLLRKYLRPKMKK